MSGTSDKMLWGINPSILYDWTPAQFQVIPEGFNEAWDEEERKLDGEGVKKGTDEYKTRMRDAVRTFWLIPWEIAEGAPILKLAPLSERTSMRLQAASRLYEQLKDVAKERLDKKIASVNASKISKQEKEIAIDDLIFAAKTENIKRGESAFDDDLRFEVLSEAVKGWKNIKAEWTGKWDVDAKALLPEWKSAAFRALLEGTAYNREEAEGFTSQPGSGAA